MDGLAGNQARNLEDMTLKYDGTTKNGYYIVEVEVETKENTHFFGSPETMGGNTDYVDTTVTVLGKVDPCKVQDKVSNTMTDWSGNKYSSRQGIGASQGGITLNSFRRSMHPLDSIHKQCDEFITAHEHKLDLHKTGKFPSRKGGEGQTKATLRSIENSFHA